MAKAQESPHLDKAEQEQARENAPLRSLVIHEIIRAEGETELKRSVPATLWSALAAGLSMGFSFAVQALLAHAFKSSEGVDAISAAGYAVGFIIVVLGRQQLFTESTLTAALPVLTRREPSAFFAAARLWNVVFAANIVGTWIFALALVYGHPLPPDVEPSLAKLAHESMAHPFGDTLLRAVFAGWLIALMVWLLPTSGSARILVIAALTWVVALAKLSHIIAGSTEAAYGVLTGDAPLGAYLFHFLIPTLIGNSIGGISLVAMLNHAPVAPEMQGDGGS